MLTIFGVRIPEVKAQPPKAAEVRFGFPKAGQSRRATPIIYEYRRYASWAEAERETGLTVAKLRWDIRKASRGG